MRIAHKTDIGCIRQVNEDRALVLHNMNGFALAVVADGMGGHQAGDTASQITVDTVRFELEAALQPGMDEEACLTAIREAIYKANDTVFEAASRKEHFHGMGTTVVVALATDRAVMIGHIGDSRAYLAGETGMRQLTDDHTLVNELIKNGQISKEEAFSHPHRNVIMRALGTEQTVEVDVQVVEWKDNDKLLLCSDGLSSLVPEQALIDILRTDESPETKVDRLVGSALAAGGDDNVTVVLLENGSHQDMEAR